MVQEVEQGVGDMAWGRTPGFVASVSSEELPTDGKRLGGSSVGTADISGARPVALILSFSGQVHKNGCYSLRRAYKVVAPEIEAEDAPAFIRARKLEACGACFPGLRDAMAAEKAARR